MSTSNAGFQYSVTRHTRTSRLGLGITVLLCIGFLLGPLWTDKASLELLTLIFAYMVLAQTWNMMAGYGGLVSAGQQAYVGAGGYFLFLFAIGMEINLFAQSDSFSGNLSIHGVNPLIAIVLAGLICAVISIPIAFLMFRLRGAYFAIGTWVVADVCRQLFFQLQHLGGGSGYSLPAKLAKSTYGIDWVKSTLDVKSSLARVIVTYEIATVLMILVMAAIYLILRSRYGLRLAAIRDNERAARSVGINQTAIKYFVYVIAALVTGMTGALIFLNKLRISPDAAFSLQDWTAYVIFIVVIGGLGTMEGPIIGVIVYFVLREFLADFATWYLIILGLTAIVFMLYAPHGIWGMIHNRWGIQLFPVQKRLILHDDLRSSNQASDSKT